MVFLLANNYAVVFFKYQGMSLHIMSVTLAEVTDISLCFLANFSDYSESAFVSSLANVLDIEPSRIEVINATAGSVVLFFRIYDATGSPASAVVANLADKVPSHTHTHHTYTHHGHTDTHNTKSNNEFYPRESSPTICRLSGMIVSCTMLALLCWNLTLFNT